MLRQVNYFPESLENCTLQEAILCARDKYMHAFLLKKKKTRAEVSQLFSIKEQTVNSLACEVHTLVTATS